MSESPCTRDFLLYPLLPPKKSLKKKANMQEEHEDPKVKLNFVIV